jgi:hypothetical protein
MASREKELVGSWEEAKAELTAAEDQQALAQSKTRVIQPRLDGIKVRIDSWREKVANFDSWHGRCRRSRSPSRRF